MIVLDTDIVTLLSYGTNEKLNKRIDEIPDDDEVAVTIITFMEILEGRFASIKKAANEGELVKAMERFRLSRTVLERFAILEIDKEAARHFQELTKEKKKPKMNRGDMLIACIALAQKALLVSRNVDDFKSVNGLEVQDWAS